jgi:hypothetical protein
MVKTELYPTCRRASSAPRPGWASTSSRARPTQRQHGGVEVGLRVLLVPVGVDLLPEVAAPVEEPHRDERKRGVRGGLAVVAGEDAEPAGVDLHRLVDPVLGAEVRHRAGQRGPGIRVRRGPVPGVRPVGEVALELVEEPAGVDHEVLVGQQLGPSAGLDRGEDGDRAPIARPSGRVDSREERPRARGPAPPQVVGQLAQPLERGRQPEIVAWLTGHPDGGNHRRPIIGSRNRNRRILARTSRGYRRFWRQGVPYRTRD